MTPQEMHIQIDQALQRVSSNVYDNFEPVELDLILNKMVLRYIDDKFRQDAISIGFSKEQGDLDDIQYLIEYDKHLPALLDSSHDKTYGILPSDYLYLLNDRCRINDDCSVSDLLQATPYLEENIAVIPFINSAKSSDLYEKTILTVGGVDLYNGSVIIQDIIEKHLVRNEIIDSVNQRIRAKELSGITGIYWERYRDTYKKESFIIITTSLFLFATTSLNIDDVIVQGSVTQITGLTKSPLTHTREVDNRLVKSQHLHSNLNNNTYYKTNRRNPISSLSKDRLHVYYDKKYIPTEIIIDYIRKPQDINLSLNRSCELKEHSHSKIIDLAVEYIKNTIEQQSYEIKLKDNQLRSE